MGYSVLIIEDEQIERAALSLMIKINIENIDNIVEASNGIEAIEIYKKNNFDIALVDINLPGLDGISVIKELKRFNKSTNFIIVSAIDTFQYVREALRLDVSEYILKPIKLKELISSINEILKSKTTEILKNNNSSFENKINQLIPFLEDDCIYSLSNSGNEDVLRNYFEFRKIKNKVGFVVAIDVNFFQKKVLKNVKESLAKIGIDCIGTMYSEVIVLLITSKTELEIVQYESIINLLYTQIKEIISNCKLGVGKLYSDYRDYSKSYQQAIQSLSRTNERDSVKSFYNITQDVSENHIILYKTKDKLISAILSFNKNEINKVVDDFTYKVPLKNKEERNILYRLHLLLFDYFQKELNHKIDNMMSAEEFLNIKDSNVLIILFKKEIIALSNEIETNGECQSKNLVKKAINYIWHNYSKELSLNIVADYLNISPFYLSRIIKNATDKNFTDYVTSIRIEKAKEFMDENQYSIKEITYKVGFRSQAYFSKVFKKYTGISPTEYN